jgi:hypothetical protein
LNKPLHTLMLIALGLLGSAFQAQAQGELFTGAPFFNGMLKL